MKKRKRSKRRRRSPAFKRPAARRAGPRRPGRRAARLKAWGDRVAGDGLPAKLADVFRVGTIAAGGELIFRSQRDGKMYRHTFKHPLAIMASPNARGLLILKGNISVERSTLQIRG